MRDHNICRFGKKKISNHHKILFFILFLFQADLPNVANHIIGHIHLRQQRIQLQSCDVKLPYIATTCLNNQGTMTTENFGESSQWQHSDGYHGYFMFRWSSLYDKSGFIVELDNNRFVDF